MGAVPGGAVLLLVRLLKGPEAGVVAVGFPLAEGAGKILGVVGEQNLRGQSIAAEGIHPVESSRHLPKRRGGRIPAGGQEKRCAYPCAQPEYRLFFSHKDSPVFTHR